MFSKSLYYHTQTYHFNDLAKLYFCQAPFEIYYIALLRCGCRCVTGIYHARFIAVNMVVESMVSRVTAVMVSRQVTAAMVDIIVAVVVPLYLLGVGG